MRYISFLFLFILCACEQKESPTTHGDPIYRQHDEKWLPDEGVREKKPPQYPWQKERVRGLPPITKEYFRCKGNPLHPAKIEEKNGEIVAFFNDCGGSHRHSLPLYENKEYIAPILLELLNMIQEKTQKKIIITSGHRCPEHNAYIDRSVQNMGAKQMIGAAVDFYIEGLEFAPETALTLIQDFYKTEPRYEGQKYFQEFSRPEKLSNTVTPPWYNKEVFIKLFLPSEGRNQDNAHTFPYINIQVRYDFEKKEPLRFSEERAHNFLRY